MMKNIKILMQSFMVALCLIGQINFCFAQTAGLLLNARQQFFDKNGNPLSSGTVNTYIPGTTTNKTTWMDGGEVNPNTNPIVLDASGYATIYGQGTYRQIVKDRNGNLIWDAVTSPGGTTSSSTLIGDGQPVGTIKPFAGIVIPNQYLFAYGQTLNRTVYPDLFAAITIVQAVTCTNSSNVLNGLADTSQISIGAVIEIICVAPGTTVTAKTATTLTMSNFSNVSQNATLTVFPWGDGDGSTTFNIPDLRGVALAGRPNMDGSLSGKGNITSTFYGSNPNGLGQNGGSQSHTLVQSELSIALGSATSVVTDPGHSHIETYGTGSGIGMADCANCNGTINAPQSTVLATTGITVATTITNASGGNAHSIIQPTITVNYIIKVTADINQSSTNGVASIGGMTGVIACGSGIQCLANTISVTGAVTSVNNSDNTINIAPTTGNVFASLNLSNINTWLAKQSFADGDFQLNGSSSGGTVIKAPATGGGTATLFSGSDTILGVASTATLTNKTFASSTDVLGGVTATFGSDATGDMYYRNAGGILTRLPVCTGTNVIGVSAGIPACVAQSSSAMVLLNTLTASNSATLSDVTSFTNIYSQYEIVFENLVIATNQQNILFQIHSGGAFKSTGYLAASWVASSGASASTTGVVITSNSTAGTLPANAAPGVSGRIRVITPSTSGIIAIFGEASYISSGAAFVFVNAGGFWNTAAVVDGFQVLSGSGNLTSGVIKIYGIL